MQDALISVNDLTYDRAARRFSVVANRFRWEGRPETAEGTPPFERTLCAVSFAEVDRVSYRGFRRRADGRILSLLAIRPGNEPGIVELEFSGGAGGRPRVPDRPDSGRLRPPSPRSSCPSPTSTTT